MVVQVDEEDEPTGFSTNSSVVTLWPPNKDDHVTDDDDSESDDADYDDDSKSDAADYDDLEWSEDDADDDQPKE